MQYQQATVATGRAAECHTVRHLPSQISRAFSHTYSNHLELGNRTLVTPWTMRLFDSDLRNATQIFEGGCLQLSATVARPNNGQCELYY